MNANAKQQTTVVMTYNSVSGYAPGGHGNGRVIIVQRSASDFSDKEKAERARLDLAFGAFGLFMNGVDQVYIYLGDIDNERNHKAADAMLGLALGLVDKDPSRIKLVACNCHWDSKRAFARRFGSEIIECGCGGESKLGAIVREILATVPAEPKPQKPLEIRLEPDFVHQAGGQHESFCRFATVGERLFAGCNTGEVFGLTESGWQKTAIKMRQGVNVMTADGDDLLIGDGSCCAGSVWRLRPDGSIGQLVPVAGQSDGERGDLNGNVYGLIRHQGRLLAGVGGCAGRHIYRLDKDGYWQYLKNDPEQYVTAMFVDSGGRAFIAMGSQWSDEGIYRYDGRFHQVGLTAAGVHAFCEHEGKVYVAATNSGNCWPTNFSKGYIYELDGEEMRTVWNEAGGVHGFFAQDGRLYAFGQDHRKRDGNTELLVLEDGKWRLLTRLDQSLYFFVHGGQLYAGGRSGQGDSQHPAIFRVGGIG